MEYLWDSSPPGQLVLGILSSFFLWFTFYNLLCLRNPSQSYEWHCRVVTFTHATIISCMSFVFGWCFNPWLFTNPGGPNTVYEVLVITLCLGYFIFDFGWCLWFWGQESALMFIHHILSIVGMVVSLSWGVSGTEVSGTIFGSEISNPLLQLRWFMRETGQTGTWYYELNDLMFIGTFFFCRICLGSCLLYSHSTHPRPTRFFKVGGLGMYLVGWCFMLGIARFAVYKYGKMCREWKKRKFVVAKEGSRGKCAINGVNGPLVEDDVHGRIANGTVGTNGY